MRRADGHENFRPPAIRLDQPTIDRPRRMIDTMTRWPARRAGAERDVGAAWCVVAELDDSHDVQDAVGAPVPGPGQAVALLVTGGGVQLDL